MDGIGAAIKKEERGREELDVEGEAGKKAWEGDGY